MTQTNAGPQLTVVGLFEDVIDANHALADLKDGPAPPEGVSLIVREQIPPDADGANAAPAVATALSEAALDQAGEWLMHLVSLVVPNEGAFLVAGPLGAILAGSESVSRWNESAEGKAITPNDETRPLLTALARFGYGEDEADYLSQRIIAGSVLIGLTTPDSQQASEARRIFADQNAVHIGTNWTDPETASRAETLVRGPVEADSDDKVVVFESVSLLVGLCGHENPEIAATCGGATVVDRNGEETGTIEDLLAEIQPDGTAENDMVVFRYVVIAFGGLLGLGRSFVAVPAVYVALEADPAVLDMDRRSVHSAPLYHPNKPFSRHEEELVCAHFGCPRYWL
ncbi:hypothetical protein BH24CHL1_BH24CHL1_20130 [soil metagenome]